MRVRCLSGNRDLILYVLERELGEAAVYCGSPDFSFSVKGFTLLRSGWIDCPEEDDTEPRGAGVLNVLASLGLCLYPPVGPDPDENGNSDIPAGCRNGEDGIVYPMGGRNGESRIIYPMDGRDGEDGISYPMDGWDGAVLMNLLRILSARYVLLNRALDAPGAFYVEKRLMLDMEAHPPETAAEFLQMLYGREEDYRGIGFSPVRFSFPGFRKAKPEEGRIHRQLADRMTQAARNRNWAKAFTRNVRNRKYAFRTWMNSIGMTGPEYEEARRVLLGRLPGRSDRRRL